MVRIHGAVERVDAQAVLGWARAFGSDLELSVEVMLGEELIGQGRRGLHRPDLGGDFGFRVQCSSAVTPLDVISQRLRVVARTSDAGHWDLPVLPSLRSQQMAQFAASAMQDYSSQEIARVLDAIGTLPGIDNLGSPPTALNIGARERTAELLKSLRSRGGGPGAAPAVSLIPVPVGFVSRDGAAVLGTNGQAYLVGGSNLVLEQFLLPPDHPSVAATAARWREAILSRAAGLKAMGVGFLQVILPEKLSIWPDDFPFDVATPSRLLCAVEAAMSMDPQVENVFIWKRERIAPNIGTDLVFGHLDSHLTARGAYTLFIELLARLGCDAVFDLDLGQRVNIVGDLAERFFGIPLLEVYEMPGNAFTAKTSEKLELVERFIPQTDHCGTRLVWQNEAAPLDLCIVAFANSFFERGGSARSLSWWFCRAVREFHFIWSPDLDFDYVRRIAPDWVICQTIERFLARAPRDVGLNPVLEVGRG
jgi:hypothetical protein